MADPFPYEVKKCGRPLDEEELRACHRDGRELIAVVRTTSPQKDDPSGPRYWHYFRVQGYVDIQNPAR